MGYPNKTWREFIPDGSANKAIKAWHEAQPDRVQTVASPSTLTECPRVVWLKKHGVADTNVKGWGFLQRLLLGRNFENQIAEQYKAAGKLLWHWKDDVPGESVKFTMGEGLDRLEGTPDLLLDIDGYIAISDAKTSRADSFAYVPLDAEEAFKDPLWRKYKLQVTAYYMLCHKNIDWFNTANLIRGRRNRPPLPLPNICHLFSFALDDGVVKREFTWKATKELAEEIMRYTRRWNTAYQSETMPGCVCEMEDGVKFCRFGTEFTTTKTGYKLATKCCNVSVKEKV